MAEDSQTILADAIVDDDEKLKEKVKLLVRKYSIILGLRRTHLIQVGHDVTLDSEYSLFEGGIGNGFGVTLKATIHTIHDNNKN